MLLKACVDPQGGLCSRERLRHLELLDPELPEVQGCLRSEWLQREGTSPSPSDVSEYAF